MNRQFSSNIDTMALPGSAAAATAPARQQQQQSQFERLILPHQSSLYGPAYQLTRNASDAEDLVQDTLLRAYTRFGSFRPDGSPRAWLHTLMRNLFITGWRRKTREPQQVSLDALPESGAGLLAAAGSGSVGMHTAAPDAWATPTGRPTSSPSSAAAEPSPERVVLNRAEEDAVLRAVAGLPREFRDVVVLSDVNGLSYQEIADRLQVPVGTVRSRLSRGRKRVQQALVAWHHDPVVAATPGLHPQPKLPVLA